MRRLLFVDDESKVLEGLRRMLRPLRKEWEMEFAEGGEAALAALEAGDFHVIVSDMRMPGMSGTELLTECKRLYPGMVRIVLSGHVELEMGLQSVAVAHQFLHKPCDAESLRRVLTRSAELQELLDDPALRTLTGGIDSLPLLPHTYLALTAAVADENVSLDKIAAIVAPSPVLTAKVMQLVNSAFIGLSRPVSDLKTAIHNIGLKTLRNVVLYVEVVHSLQDEKIARSFNAPEHERHSGIVARLAGSLLEDDAASKAAHLGGMLHDIGEFLLAVRRPDEFDEITQLCIARDVDRHVIEYERWGFSHAEIGAYLLGIWGLPHPIVEAVANHHQPARVGAHELDATTAVHVADALVAGQASGEEARLDHDYIQAVLAAEHLQVWRDKAARILDSVREKEPIHG